MLRCQRKRRSPGASWIFDSFVPAIDRFVLVPKGPEPRDHGPKVTIPSLGPATDAPRRAATRPTVTQGAASRPLPQPLPLSRSGDTEESEGLSAFRPQIREPQPPRQTSPKDVIARVGPDDALGRDPSRVEAPPGPPSFGSRLKSEVLDELPAKITANAVGKLRELPAIVTGTPHLAYLAGLLLLCCLGAIWFVLSDHLPREGTATAGSLVSDSSTASAAPAASPEAAAAAAGPEEGLTFSGIKAAPVLSGDEADAFLGDEAAQSILPAPVEVAVPASPGIITAEPVVAPSIVAGVPADTLAQTEGAEAQAPQQVAETTTPSPSATETAVSPAADGELASSGSVPQDLAASGEAAAPATQASGGPYTIQFFAARDLQSAERALAQIEEARADLLGSLGLRISETDPAEGRVMYRVRSEGFADAEAARSLCGRLKSAGQDCLVLRQQ